MRRLAIYILLFAIASAVNAQLNSIEEDSAKLPFSRAFTDSIVKNSLKNQSIALLAVEAGKRKVFIAGNAMGNTYVDYVDSYFIDTVTRELQKVISDDYFASYTFTNTYYFLNKELIKVESLKVVKNNAVPFNEYYIDWYNKSVYPKIKNKKPVNIRFFFDQADHFLANAKG